MREILFRGKRKVCDEWVYGFPFISRKGEYKIKWYDGYYGSSKTSEIYPKSIGQFTGLTDKNGKMIFEGDIVDIVGEAKEYITEEQQRFVVKWQDEDCGFSLLIMFDYEVIGNIHDNPELLEGKE